MDQITVSQKDMFHTLTTLTHTAFTGMYEKQAISILFARYHFGHFSVAIFCVLILITYWMKTNFHSSEMKGNLSTNLKFCQLCIASQWWTHSSKKEL